jgi:hypothetical protein
VPYTLTPEEQAEVARFPAVLRALVEGELAAGNTIVEIGHRHPAPPAGAFVKLARKVTTRARTSGDGLDFYERQSSQHSGEFTDGRRFFWVLEPPDPPPPEPDMDAIRRALEPRPTPLVALARRETRAWAGAPTSEAAVPAVAERPAGRAFELCFADARPPHEVAWALERAIMTRFVREPGGDGLSWRGEAIVNAAVWTFLLRFDAARPTHNHFTLQAEVSWAHLMPEHHDYERRSSTGWFALWTRDLATIGVSASDRGAEERYAALCRDAEEAESRLASIAAVQRAILDGLRRGGRYSTSHKEGGTTITWRANRFVREDYGDDPAYETWTDEAAFLAALWRFCQWDATRHARDRQRSDLDTWTLILRLLRPA